MNKGEVLQVLIYLSAIIGTALVYEKVFKTDRRLAAIAHALARSYVSAQLRPARFFCKRKDTSPQTLAASAPESLYQLWRIQTSFLI